MILYNNESLFSEERQQNNTELSITSPVTYGAAVTCNKQY